ncbi:MAG: hypothetical protein ACH346_02300 [Chthoniobacterales bacterium]
MTEKATEATASGKPAMEDLWTQAARQAQATSESYLQLAQALSTGAEEATVGQYQQAAQAADEALKKLAKDAEAGWR